MKNELQKRYGFWTAVAMVIGIVIGSGVFFKSDDVLTATNGNLPLALLAWLIGGTIMIVNAYMFAKMATKIQKVNGLVDYFEVAYGEKAGYMVSWFMSTMYYPGLVAVLAWVSANYTMALFQINSNTLLWSLAFGYLTVVALMNVVSPMLAGRFQVSTTIIKLIPLSLVAVVGTISGLISGQLVSSFTHAANTVANGSGGGLAVATVATAFAYEGWIIATSINSELRDPRKDLPKALIVGTLTIMVAYMLFYLGISGVLSNNELLAAGDNAPVEVLSLVFSNVGGTILTVFVVVSCLGTLNGLTMGNTRGLYSGAVRGFGPCPKILAKVHTKTETPLASALLGYLFAVIWLVVWYGNFAGWFQGFLDFSELPIVFLYVIYLSIYLWYVRNFTELSVIPRFIIPALATCGSCYMIYGASQKDMFLTFCIIFAVVMITGFVFSKKQGLE